MSFGDDTPDAPDYSDLMDQIKEVYSTSTARADDQWDFFKNLYNENKGMFDQVTDTMLGYMDKQYEDYENYRSRRRNVFEPMEDALVAEAESYASPERKQYEAGKAEADVAAQSAQARQTASDRLEAFGVDPSQTRQGALDLGSRVYEAAAQVGAGNQARDKVDEIARKLRSEAIAVGSAYPGYMTSSATAAGNTGTTGANMQLSEAASAAQTQGTPSTWAGMGSTALSMLGNVMNTSYQNELQKYQGDQEDMAGWGTAIGTGVGAFFGGPAGAAIGSQVGGGAGSQIRFAEGGAIPDEEGMYLPEEMSPSGGVLTDDIDAEIDGEQPAQLNAGEFVVPEDVVKWLGEKGMQQIILKARKEMMGQNGERPAQAEMSQPPPPQYAGAGAIPA